MRNFKLLAIALIAIAVVAVIAVLFLVRPFQPSGSASSTPAPVANTTRSQGSSVKLSVAIPNFLGSLFTDRLISAFESAHPGVKLSVVKVDANIPPAALGLDQHLRAVEQYTSSADVVYLASTSYLGNTTRLSAEATRAGYILNLKPLVNIDTKLNPDDFFPALWQSYQWDQGIWALPLAADPYVLTYLPSAFDTAGIAYPGWHGHTVMASQNRLEISRQLARNL